MGPMTALPILNNFNTRAMMPMKMVEPRRAK
jgi:hypothetical protein